MVARVTTVAFQGFDVLDVDVQVQMSSGLPAFTIVGLPDKAVAESRERVRGALHAMGLALPSKRITVNLAPADLLKEGSHFDLPIALGLLAAMEVLPADEIAGFVALGELALDGGLSRVMGVLPAAIHADALGLGLICPGSLGGEAAWAANVQVLAPDTLLALINHFKGTQVLSPPQARLADNAPHYPDMSDIKGQETAKRAVEIAAAGGHNLLMVGPPGAGKSMLAARLPGLLPPLDAAEVLEISMIRSLAGELPDGALTNERPFREPHHSASMAALVGGGQRAKPGEVSLAHLGVLFLDELPEFQKPALEALRQPLEAGRVTVARANAHVTYPARIQLIAAMNPCRCGYLDNPAEACSRAPNCARDYQGKISGPLFDRIDLHVEVPAVNPADLDLPPPMESSGDIAARIAKARAIQKQRFEHLGSENKLVRTNADADGKLLDDMARPDDAGRRLLVEASDRLGLTARGYHRVLRVARTLADLDGATPDDPALTRIHIAEALSYRRVKPGQSAIMVEHIRRRALGGRNGGA